ncbi:MAG: lipid A biosynthesis acyltransferase [Campylobacterales bacterium]|nr:lipid A biosynthesis acyltransferase [Campylobacterales bacterium]
MGYKLLLILEKILMVLPKSWRKAFFTCLANLAYYVSPKYRRVVEKNLNFAFDNSMSKEEIDSITRYSFKNLLYNFLHILEIRNITQDELLRKVDIVGKEKLDKITQEGRAIIYATPHYSSWELGGVSLGLLQAPVACVYKKMKNPTYENWLLQGRARFGNANLEKSNVVKPLIKLIRDKKASAILIDTNINPKDGVIVNFMGKTLRQTSTPAYLARKFNAAIVPIAIRTDDEEHYTIRVFDEIVVEKTDDEKADILKATQAQADWLSSLIKEEPKFWFWLHKRWKNDHPEIYKD